VPKSAAEVPKSQRFVPFTKYSSGMHYSRANRACSAGESRSERGGKYFASMRACSAHKRPRGTKPTRGISRVH
jgi:hypothetical protein